MSLFPGKPTHSARSKRGSVVALFALFLPVAVAVSSLVLDLGVLVLARHSAKISCDLGALAGLQEIDWELLEKGVLALDEPAAIRKALQFAEENARGTLSSDATFLAECGVDGGEPYVSLTAEGTVSAVFLTYFPKFRDGIQYRVHSRASITLRTEW